VFDREGHIGYIQLAGWAAALFAFFLVALVEPSDLDDEECSMAFHGITWGVIALLTVVVAGSSMVTDRRRGFLELVLVTPLTGRQIVDGTFLAIWEHVRRLYWLPWVLGAIFCLTGASLLLGVVLSLITATLFLALVVLYGIACSLPARTLPGGLVPAILFPLIVLGGPAALAGIFEDEHGPILWTLCAALLPAGWFWVRQQATPASVCFFLTAAHLALAALFSCWTYDGREDEFPIVAMHPGLLALLTLDNRPDRWVDGTDPHWTNVLPCYWAALGINLIWARWWIIRNFDRLAERVGPPPRLWPLPVAVVRPRPRGDRRRAAPPLPAEGPAADGIPAPAAAQPVENRSNTSQPRGAGLG
jgi:hypothetical protein